MGLIIFLIVAIINLFFAFGLLHESGKLGKQRILFSPILNWFLATLFGGPVVIAAFWVIHFSNLNEKQQGPSDQAQTPRAVLESLYDDGMLVHGKTLSTESVEEYLEQK